MKKIIKFTNLLLAMFLLFSVSSCYYDTTIEEEIVPIGDDISFENDIISIFNTSCNFTGCHSPGGQMPDLTPANAFDSLNSGGYIDITNPESSIIYLRVSGQIGTPMPVSGVDPIIRDTILAWIEQGALNN